MRNEALYTLYEELCERLKYFSNEQVTPGDIYRSSQNTAAKTEIMRIIVRVQQLILKEI